MSELTGARVAGALAGRATRLATRRTAWGLWGATLSTSVAAGLFAVLSRGTPRPEWHPWWLMAVESLIGAFLAPLGVVVATRRPRNPTGWLLLFAGLGASFDLLVHAYGLYALPRGLPGDMLAMWSANWAFLAYIIPLMFLFLLFPNGRLPSARWRLAAGYVAACGILLALLGAFMPGPLGAGYFGAYANPIGIPALSFTVTYVGLLSVLTILPSLLLSISSLLFRYRNSDGLARRRLKWVAWAVLVSVLLVTVHIVLLDGPAESIAIDLVPVILSAAITIAIVRHNLFDIDRLLSNSLLYAGLTASVVGLYVGLVSALGLLFERSGSGTVRLLATGIVAVLLQPLRTLLQRLASRLVYGLRDDPYTALTVLGRRLEAAADLDDVLPAAASTVAEALRLPYVAVELVDVPGTGVERTTAAAHGEPVPDPVRIALVHQGEEIGALLVATRAADEGFSAADTRLLHDVARHIAQAASVVRLSLALARSRERAAATAAEERRRLARDLHDGVGPVLTGATWTLQAATTLLRSDPDATRELLTNAVVHLRQGTEDLRDVAQGLRSPADQLGLREAILVHLERVPLNVRTTLPEEIPRLPAAVEEAAYWILAEATANVVRHAGADTCWVRLDLNDDDLALAVADDGRGLPARFRPGVGLGSIRERAAEIGGTCRVAPRAAGGTEVHARLPLSLPGIGRAEHAGGTYGPVSTGGTP
ncbi:hypothetical protein GCM10010252_62450 [Streptomyces aureoverticillatus]|nr:hypothetical protein GCM10010252_62450 [Streptomyces aureoverticillatus]